MDSLVGHFALLVCREHTSKFDDGLSGVEN